MTRFLVVFEQKTSKINQICTRKKNSQKFPVSLSKNNEIFPKKKTVGASGDFSCVPHKSIFWFTKK
jgi:hypothetical protein